MYTGESIKQRIHQTRYTNTCCRDFTLFESVSYPNTYSSNNSFGRVGFCEAFDVDGGSALRVETEIDISDGERGGDFESTFGRRVWWRLEVDKNVVVLSHTIQKHWTEIGASIELTKIESVQFEAVGPLRSDQIRISRVNHFKPID